MIDRNNDTRPLMKSWKEFKRTTLYKHTRLEVGDNLIWLIYFEAYSAAIKHVDEAYETVDPRSNIERLKQVSKLKQVGGARSALLEFRKKIRELLVGEGNDTSTEY